MILVSTAKQFLHIVSLLNREGDSGDDHQREGVCRCAERPELGEQTLPQLVGRLTSNVQLLSDVSSVRMAAC